MTKKPCLTCGTLTTIGSYCEKDTKANRKAERPRSYARECVTYDHRWKQLSKRMRKSQPWCSHIDDDGRTCGATTDLVLDHSAEAYARQALGQVLTADHVEVICRMHNGVRSVQRG